MAAAPKSRCRGVSARACTTWHASAPCQEGWEEMESARIRSADHQGLLWVSLALNSPDQQIRAVINGKEKPYILLEQPREFHCFLSRCRCTNTIEIFPDVKPKLFLEKAMLTEFPMKL